MSEYIKKEDAIASARALLFLYGSDNIPDEQLDEYAEALMNDDNTIVELVRCKDCKYRKKVLNCNYGECMYSACMVTDNDFCSNGEAKTNKQEKWDV